MEKGWYKKAKETGVFPPEVIESMQRINKIYKAWYNKQIKDFEDNKEAVKPYMILRSKILPPNFKRFWTWYFEYCAENDFDLTRDIEPRDFVLYDKWERKQMTPAPPKHKGEKLSVRVCAITLALAFKNKKITEEVANSKAKIISLANDLFPFNSAKVYDEWRHYKNHKKEDLEKMPEFELAKELLSKHF